MAGGIFTEVRLKETAMIWVGLDLHKRYVTACALDEAGAVVAEHRRLPTDPEVLSGGCGSWAAR